MEKLANQKDDSYANSFNCFVLIITMVWARRNTVKFLSLFILNCYTILMKSSFMSTDSLLSKDFSYVRFGCMCISIYSITFSVAVSLVKSLVWYCLVLKWNVLNNISDHRKCFPSNFSCGNGKGFGLANLVGEVFFPKQP